MYLNEYAGINLEGLKALTSRQLHLLQKIGLSTTSDVLNYFPYRYDDRSIIESIQTGILQNRPVTIIARVMEHQYIYFNGRRHPKILIQDEDTRAFLVGFNRDYLKNSLKIGQDYWVYAQFVYKYNEIQASSFDFEEYREGEKPKNFGSILPVYMLTESLYLKELRGMIRKILDSVAGKIKDELPQYILENHHLISKEEAVFEIHYPSDEAALKKAKLRLAYEEFLSIQLAVLMKRQNIAASLKSHQYKNRDAVGKFIKQLPYSLTKSQSRSLDEILNDMDATKAMHRLLQGDVGCGKTTVAAAALIYAAANGYQSALMVPTEVLAIQHFNTIRKFASGLGFSVGLLTSSVSGAEKDMVLEGIRTGKLQILVGTHALIQDTVQFRNLTMVVFDEQHKFGVEQRIKLSKKGSHPDVLVMTATPIPRTLTLTIYGDLDVSLIDELPAERKPVKTRWFTKKDNNFLIKFVNGELGKGRQAYFVYPLIEESEKVDAETVTKNAAILKKQFAEYKVGMLHGRMSPDEKSSIMEDFKSGKLAVLVSTTVIEVGIDVKNATVMVIEGADRFGLSQLHQLRGRVGRSDLQSYCALVTTSDVTEDTRARMETMVKHTDGFVIAEEDLRLRGPGEILGIRQSGLPELKIADYMRDEKLFLVARQDAQNILKDDPGLEKPKNLSLREGIINFLPADYLYSG